MRLVHACSSIIVILCVLFFYNKPIVTGAAENGQKAEVPRQEHRVQVPFIENQGDIENKEVAFFAQTFGGFGTVYVEKNGTLVYNFPLKDKNNVSFKEIFTDKHISLNPLEPPPDNVIEMFKGKGYIDQNSSISNFYRMHLGEIYKGIELEFTAYTDTIEKLFTVSPQGNPQAIKIEIQGAKGLKVDESGKMEIITERGSGQFTRPFASQIIKDQKIPVEVSYVVTKGTAYSFKLGKYDKTIPLMILF